MTITLSITRTLAGSVEELDALISAGDLVDTEGGVTSWPLAAEAVAQVVERYAAGAITADRAQAWAFFVRHGFVSTAKLPVMPIEIDWELAREEAIAVATTRLEELGDKVDGDLRQGEAQELIDMLRA